MLVRAGMLKRDNMAVSGIFAYLEVILPSHEHILHFLGGGSFFFNYFFLIILIIFLNKKRGSVLCHYETLSKAFYPQISHSIHTHYCFVNNPLKQLI